VPESNPLEKRKLPPLPSHVEREEDVASLAHFVPQTKTSKESATSTITKKTRQAPFSYFEQDAESFEGKNSEAWQEDDPLEVPLDQSLRRRNLIQGTSFNKKQDQGRIKDEENGDEEKELKETLKAINLPPNLYDSNFRLF